MKRYSKSIRDNELLVDVVEYAFIEWLVRRGIFSAFKANYERKFAPRRSFRDRLRSQVRRSLRDSGLGPSYLITTAFLFSSTPEGAEFWTKYSTAWECFCAEFQVKL